jgi:hypothetical protein
MYNILLLLKKTSIKKIIISINNYYLINQYNLSLINKPLKSGLDISSLDITGVITEVNNLLPQFSNFIDQFKNVVNQYGINVITDSVGNMSIDVPQNISDSEANNISKRIGVIDRLISTHGNTINELFQRGLNLENKLKMDNPNYTSQLTDQINQFKNLNKSYKH